MDDEAAFAAYADDGWPTLVKSHRSGARVSGADNREAYGHRMLVNTRP